MSVVCSETGIDWNASLKKLASMVDEYAGIPMPIAGEKLIVHPKYRFAKAFEKPTEELQDCTFINSWRSRGGLVFLFREKDGKTTKAFLPEQPLNLNRLLRTYGVAVVWDIKAERKAIDKLAELLNRTQFERYMLTGMFLERSKKSGVYYLFRRLRPTIAFSCTETSRFLASLCLHPIGYYDESFAGSMVPSDEVVAHLMLMRGDEFNFWKWSNQHQDIF
jgi:hypothetical protein